MAQNDLVVTLRVDGKDAIATLQRADGTIVELSKDTKDLKVSLAELEQVKRKAASAFQTTVLDAERNAYGALEQRVKAYQTQIETAAGAQRTNTAALGRSQQAYFTWSQVLNDAQQFQYGWRQGLIAISNQLPMLIEQTVAAAVANRTNAASLQATATSGAAAGVGLTAAGAGATAAGTGAKVLQASLGPLILVFSLVATAAVLFSTKSKEAEDALDRQADKAKKAREELMRLRGAQLGQRAFELRLDAQDLESQLRTVRLSMEDLRNQGKAFDTVSIGGAGNQGGGVTTHKVPTTAYKNLQAEETRLIGLQRENNTQRRIATNLVGETLEGQQALAEAEAEYYRDKATYTAADAAAAAAAQARYDAVTAEIEARDPSLNAGERAAAAEARRQGRAQAAADRAALRAQQKAEDAAEAIAERQQRIDDAIEEARIARIEDEEMREIASIQRRYDVMRREAGQGVDVSALDAEEAADVFAAQARFAAKRREDAEAFARRERDLAFDRMEVNGVAETQILRFRLLTLSMSMLGMERDSERYREAVLEKMELENALTRATNREQRERTEQATENYDRMRRAAMDVMQDAQRNADRVAQQWASSIVRIAEDVTRTLYAEMRRQRRFTQTDVDLQQLAFEQQEDALKKSLRRREITQKEYDLRVRKLAEDRANYEKEVESDRAGFLERSAKAVGQILINEAIKVAAQYAVGALSAKLSSVLVNRAMDAIIAKATVAASTVSMATFGASALTGTAAVLSGITAAVGAAKMASFPKFKDGRYTGSGDPHDVAGWVHRGEYVIPARAVGGDPRPFDELLRMLDQGVSLRAILDGTGYLAGGRVAGYLNTSTSSENAFKPVYDDTRLVAAGAQQARELAALRRDVQALANRPTTYVVGDVDARRQRYAAEREDRRVDPRRRL